MAFMLAKKFILCSVYSLLVSLVEPKVTCPQNPKLPSVNERAQRLAEDGEFAISDDENKYEYTIKLCQRHEKDDVAVLQNKVNGKGGPYIIGRYKGMQVTGGSDWLMVTYIGDAYGSHCNKSNRTALFFIMCDQSADTTKERAPKIIEEHTSKGKVEDFCYYLFEMSHSGVCPTPPKTKISPGSVFIIIVVIVGLLYLILGMLYQRFIVGAKGLEQIPNYLMWREFGTLQADGCNYMCRCKAAREPARYKPVDDAIADDDEESGDKDDNLLPM